MALMLILSFKSIYFYPNIKIIKASVSLLRNFNKNKRG